MQSGRMVVSGVARVVSLGAKRAWPKEGGD